MQLPLHEERYIKRDINLILGIWEDYRRYNITEGSFLTRFRQGEDGSILCSNILGGTNSL
jgi:hypothetical protein